MPHVQTIQPHLIGVTFFVPKTIFFVAGVAIELAAQQICGFFVLFFFGFLVQQQQRTAGRHVVDVVIFQLIGADATVFLHKMVDVFFDVVVIPYIASMLPKAFETFKYEALLVIPTGEFVGTHQDGVFVGVHKGFGHPH